MKFVLCIVLFIIGCTNKEKYPQLQAKVKSVVVEEANTEEQNPEQILFNNFFYKGQTLIKVQQPKFSKYETDPPVLNGIYWDSNKNVYFSIQFSNISFYSNNIDYSLALKTNFQKFSTLAPHLLINSNYIFHSMIEAKESGKIYNQILNTFTLVYYDTNKNSYIIGQICNIFSGGYENHKYKNEQYGSYYRLDYLPIYPTLIYTNKFNKIISNETLYTNKKGQVFYHDTFSPGIGHIAIKEFLSNQ